MSRLKEPAYRILTIVEDIGLLVLALATVVAMGFEVAAMIGSAEVTLANLLLLFIYLEVLAMAGIYLQTGKLPVRFTLYIALVAIARYMILDMKALDSIRIFALAGAMLVIAITILVIRYGHTRYPYDAPGDRQR